MVRHSSSLAPTQGSGTQSSGGPNAEDLGLQTGAKKQRPIGRVRRTYDLTAPAISRSIAPQKNMFFSRFSGYSSLAFAVLLGSVGCTEAKLPVGGLAIGAPEVPWKDKTHEERQAFMASAVEPTMRRLFVTFNKKSYGGFGCDTCHGGTWTSWTSRCRTHSMRCRKRTR